MVGQQRIEFSVTSLEETQSLAVALGNTLRNGDCILLEGPVGAGKTAFARALINSQLDPPEDIPSPTFTIVQTYDTPKFEIWHFDLYRLSSAAETIELGLKDAVESSVTIIEWPDRLGDLPFNDVLRITFKPLGADEARSITVAGAARLVRALSGSDVDA